MAGYIGEQLDLECRQGTTFSWDINPINGPDSLPLDLTGYTLRGKIKKRYSDTVATMAFTASFPAPTTGHARLTLSASTTAVPAAGKYVYDVELEDGAGTVVPLYYGCFCLLPEATTA